MFQGFTNKFFVLRDCPPHQHASSAYHINTNLATLPIFSYTRPPRPSDALTTLSIYRHKVSFPRTQRYSAYSSDTKPKVDNFTLANLRSYPLSCNAANWNVNVKIYRKNITARYAHCGHQTIDNTFTI